jgi:hypothetical protein
MNGFISDKSHQIKSTPFWKKKWTEKKFIMLVIEEMDG